MSQNNCQLLLQGSNFIGRGHCNSCLGKPLVHEGTTATPMTVEGHQGKFRFGVPTRAPRQEVKRVRQYNAVTRGQI